MNKRALSLVEIIVATVILALVVTGLANVFVSGKRYIKQSRLRMAGGEIGKKFLDPIQSEVRQDTWSTNPLGTNSVTGSTTDGYVPTYETKDLKTINAANPDIKRVKVTIQLPNTD